MLKKLMEFIKAHDGMLSYDNDLQAFTLQTPREHCAFKIPEDHMTDGRISCYFLEPAMAKLEKKSSVTSAAVA